MDGPELGHRGWPRFPDCFSSCIPLGSNSPSPGVPNKYQRYQSHHGFAKTQKKMDQSKNLPAHQGKFQEFSLLDEGVFDHVCLRCAEISKPGQGKLRSLFAPNDTIRYSAESKHRSLLSTS